MPTNTKSPKCLRDCLTRQERFEYVFKRAKQLGLDDNSAMDVSCGYIWLIEQISKKTG